MEYTEQQRAEFVREFSRRKSLQLKVVLPVVIAAVVVLSFTENANTYFFGIPSNLAGPAAIVVIVIAVIFSLFNWRCPACRRYLGKGIPNFCPKCGVGL